MIKYTLTHTFKRYSLRTDYMPGTVISFEDTSVSMLQNFSLRNKRWGKLN